MLHFLLCIQISVVAAIATQFGFTMEKNEAKDIVVNLSKSSDIGVAVATTGKKVGSIIKLFPGIGSVIGGTICANKAGIDIIL